MSTAIYVVKVYECHPLGSEIEFRQSKPGTRFDGGSPGWGYVWVCILWFKQQIEYTPGGHSTLGYAPCATMPPKRSYFFMLAFTERPPFLPTFTQWPPIFNTFLVTERPWHIFVTQRPLIFASDNFWQKIGFFKNFDKFDKMLRNCCPFWPWKHLFFNAFH